MMWAIMFWHDFVRVAAKLIPFNSGFFVLLLLLFTGLFGILFDLFDSVVFVILLSNSLWIITWSHPLMVVCLPAVGWIMFAVMDASLDTFEVLAIVIFLILLAMVYKLATCHRFLVERDLHGISNNIRFSYTLWGILVFVFLEEIFKALDRAPLYHLYVDISTHFIQLFGRSAYLTCCLVLPTNNLELGADIASLWI